MRWIALVLLAGATTATAAELNFGLRTQPPWAPAPTPTAPAQPDTGFRRSLEGEGLYDLEARLRALEYQVLQGQGVDIVPQIRDELRVMLASESGRAAIKEFFETEFGTELLDGFAKVQAERAQQAAEENRSWYETTYTYWFLGLLGSISGVIGTVLGWRNRISVVRKALGLGVGMVRGWGD